MTNKKIAFVTDSTASLTEKLRNHPDVYIMPNVIISNGQAYEDGVELNSDQLYDMIRTHKEVPKTSQPSIGKFQQLYEDLSQNYQQVIAVHVSSRLSGTIKSSIAARGQVSLDTEVIDSRSASYGMTMLIEKAILLAEQNMDVAEIAEQLRNDVSQSRNIILLGKLDQLFKGGRMSGAQFLLGNVLQIKPILTINEDGELGLFERVRSEKKATNRIIALLKKSSEENRVKQLGIMHGNAFDKATKLKQQIEEAVPNTDIVVDEISSSLAVHAGEGTIAIFWK